MRRRSPEAAENLAFPARSVPLRTFLPGSPGCPPFSPKGAEPRRSDKMAT